MDFGFLDDLKSKGNSRKSKHSFKKNEKDRIVCIKKKKQQQREDQLTGSLSSKIEKLRKQINYETE